MSALSKCLLLMVSTRLCVCMYICVYMYVCSRLREKGSNLFTVPEALCSEPVSNGHMQC